MQLNSFFFKGIMNKSSDERILPPGEYVDALNARLGSTEDSEIGSVENTKGNTKITNITNQGVALSANAICIGSYADESDETIYWFVTDPSVVDLIISFNVKTSVTIYHIISTSILNFNPSNLITGVELIDRFLIFTDNLNPPRKINVDRSYAFPIGGVDQITEDEINLIVKPPISPPTFTLSSADGDDQSFFTDKFISFAYRFKYEDGEYSALSPFSLPAFEPENPDLVEVDFNTIKNESMVNAYNAATVFFSTGSNLVKEIEVCYKESSSTVIKVIDKYNKSDLGWADNSTQSIFFRNKEVFRVLSANESLRLYDNVPLKAKALTSSGNRLMFGNYVDGYDMKSADGNDVKLNYVTSLSGAQSNIEPILGVFVSSDYQVLNGSSTPSTVSVDNSKAVFDFGLTQFTQGSFVSFNATLKSYATGGNIYNQNASVLNLTRPTGGFTLTISSNVQLTNTYPDVASFVGSTDFENLIGTGLATATPVYKPFSDASTGSTATDFINNSVIISPATNSVTSSAATPVNSAVPNAAAAASTPASPAYPTGQTGLLETFDIATPTQVTIQSLMMVYETGSTKSFEGLEFISSSFEFDISRGKETLHSNRDYDLAMVYMDDYARSSTALVSLDSSINVPPSNSTIINRAQVNIPVSQKAPSWAKYYKFAIKPSKLNYDTIFIIRAEPDLDDTTQFWCLLEGETAQKITDGETYTVKRDINGPLVSFVEATCLAKSTSPNIDTAAATYPGPGVYAKFSPGGNYRLDAGNIITTEKAQASEKNITGNGKGIQTVISGLSGKFTGTSIPEGSNITIKITCEREQPEPFFTRTSEMFFKYSKLDITRTANKTYQTYSTFAENLEDMIDSQFVNNQKFFPGTSVNYSGNKGVSYKFQLNNTLMVNDANPVVPTEGNITTSNAIHSVSFNVSGGNAIGFQSSFPTIIQWQNNGTSKISAKVVLSNIPDGLVVFETDGEDTPDEFYYEGNEVFDINGDLHDGNLQNQNNWAFYDNAQNNTYRSSQGLPASQIYGGNLALTSTGGTGLTTAPFSVGDIVNVQQTNLSPTNPQYNGQHTVLEKPDANTIVLDVAFGASTPVEGGTVNADAIVLTNFFNSYCWSNGMESCKIQDSFKEDALNIGERVFTLSEGEFRQKRRNASITYSGIYNDETKLNRTNEFNLGILNFKDLNEDFGNIELLKARQNDLLVLQEDKISYVLVNKNVLTSADGLSNVTSTPTILGNQVARLEEYGISHNPESYAEFGYDKYFTDSKRGAVIKLSGSSYSNESLEVISQAGMRSYFRDLFIDDFNTQKIGGYDPYMNEYVLSSNNRTLPVEAQTVNCGSELEFNNQTASFTYTVKLGASIGTTDIDYNVTSGNINISVTYNGATTSSGSVTGSGTFQFNKNIPSIETAVVTVAVVGVSANYSITAQCPTAAVINVYQICLNNEFTGLAPTIHNQYEWASSNLTPSVSSPLINQPVTFTNVATGTGVGTQRVAQYQAYASQVAIGTTPTPESVVTVKSAKTGSDSFDFNTNNGNRLLHLLSNTTYANTQADIISLLAASTNLTISNTSTGVFEGSFNYANPDSTPTNYTNLYLIYDYRSSTQVNLSFGSTESIVCGGTGVLGPYFLDAAVPSEATVVYNDAAMTVPAADGYYLYVNPNPTVVDTYWLRQSSGRIVQVSQCSG
jgi:hypothetical protein